MSAKARERITHKSLNFAPILYPRVFPNISELRIGALLKTVINTEQNTINWLRENGLLPMGVKCKCGMSMREKMKQQALEKITWRCPLKKCRNTASIRQGSLFQQTRQPLQQIVDFLYLWAEDLVDPDFVIRYLGWSKNIVLEWQRLLREVCKYKIQLGEKGRRGRKRSCGAYSLKFKSNRLKPQPPSKRSEDKEDEAIEKVWREKFGEEALSNLVAHIREIRPVV